MSTPKRPCSGSKRSAADDPVTGHHLHVPDLAVPQDLLRGQVFGAEALLVAPLHHRIRVYICAGPGDLLDAGDVRRRGLLAVDVLARLDGCPEVNGTEVGRAGQDDVVDVLAGQEPGVGVESGEAGVVGDLDRTERFLWDYRRTVSDLINRNFYAEFRSICAARGILLEGEGWYSPTVQTLARHYVKRLGDDLKGVLRNETEFDTYTRAHLEECNAKLSRALEASYTLR